MKKLMIISGIFLGAIGIILLSGYHFSQESAIPWNVRIVQSEETVYGEAVIFEDMDTNTFGVARIKEFLGYLYKFDGASYGHIIEDGRPFKATGFGNDSTDGFIVGVKTAKTSEITTVVVGNHLKELTPSDQYSLTMDEVWKRKDQYEVAQVKNNYALLILDEYSEETWTIRAFDKNGQLIADKLFGSDPRYLK